MFVGMTHMTWQCDSQSILTNSAGDRLDSYPKTNQNTATDVFLVVFEQGWSRVYTYGGLVWWEMLVGSATDNLSLPEGTATALIEGDSVKKDAFLVVFGRGWSRVYN